MLAILVSQPNDLCDGGKIVTTNRAPQSTQRGILQIAVVPENTLQPSPRISAFGTDQVAEVRGCQLMEQSRFTAVFAQRSRIGTDPVEPLLVPLLLLIAVA